MTPHKLPLARHKIPKALPNELYNATLLPALKVLFSAKITAGPGLNVVNKQMPK